MDGGRTMRNLRTVRGLPEGDTLPDYDPANEELPF